MNLHQALINLLFPVKATVWFWERPGVSPAVPFKPIRLGNQVTGRVAVDTYVVAQDGEGYFFAEGEEITVNPDHITFQ